MVLLNSGFPHAKELLRKVSAIWARAFKNIRQPCPAPKKLQEYRFDGRQVISLPEAPTWLWSVLFIVSFYDTKHISLLRKYTCVKK
jgi:hypothetical protein